VARTLDDVHDAIRTAVAERADTLWQVALKLHADPEYAFAEHRAAALLTDELERAGFAVEAVLGGYEGEAFSSGSRVMLLVALRG
jgi:metal-dependent amidase/aminoacylase/carboxypeptidase family protein